MPITPEIRSLGASEREGPGIWPSGFVPRPSALPARAHVLVVDDDAAARGALAKLLSADGFSISTAANGEEALAAVDHSATDVVLTDLQMPGFDGVELCRRLRERDHHLPVVVMSASSDMQVVLQSLRAGAQDYLLKPLEYEVVRLCVNRLLAQRNAALELDRLRRHSDEIYRTLNERLVLSSIREQEHADAEAEQRARLNTLLANLGEGVAIADASGRVSMVNDVARTILSFGEREVKDVASFHSWLGYHSDGRRLEAEELPLARALRGEQFSDWEVRCKLPNDEQRTVVFTGSSVKDESNRVVLAIVVFRDVTQLRRLEVQREEYLALISHDLRGPLNNILMLLTLLRQGMEKAGLVTYANLATRAEANVKQTTTMIDELSESSSLELHGAVLNRVACDLRELVAEAIAGLDDARAARVAFRSEGTSPSYFIFADSARIRRVITNLLSNALKYSAEDAAVQVRLKLKQGVVELEVSDRGIGIAQENLKRLFDRYYRAPGGRAKASGLGLGLYIVRLIAEAHGGRIGVYSEVGKGSTFRLSLPAFCGSSDSR